jgi:YcxB-like protein
VTSTQASNPVEPLSFQFTWDQAEHARMIRAVTRHRLTGWFRRSAVELILGGFVVFVLLIPLLRRGANPWIVWRAAALWIVILAMWYVLLRLALPYLAACSFRRDNHCARRPMRRVVSSQGLRTECETTSTDVRWSGVHGVVETPEFFLFYVTPVCAVQLPKRAIATPMELNRLRSLLREQLDERANLQSGRTGDTS